MQNSLEAYFDRLWPLNRSLTGDGNRQSLDILSEILPLQSYEVPSGTPCFDWEIPPEWNVREAYILDQNGHEVVNFQRNNLHLLGYSTPVDRELSFEELRPHLHTIPEQPELIPYRTSYYQSTWGFCLSHRQLESLDLNGRYRVVIDAELNDEGSLTYADLVLPGRSKQEILFSTYICHPSMANNELSGPLVTAFLGRELMKRELQWTYRFVFVPETIGPIYYLSKHGEHLKEQLRAGYVVTTVGDAGDFTYKRSRRGDAEADRAAELVLAQTEDNYLVEDFFPIGSDERQYCSPGFNLPVGSLMRTRYYNYPEYHTSGDNKDLISFEALAASVEKYLQVVEVLEHNGRYRSLLPYGEPQLGKRGLYPPVGAPNRPQQVEAMMWVLNLADGEHSLLDMAERSGKHYQTLITVIRRLLEKGVIERL